jgi:hypothetical protein
MPASEPMATDDQVRELVWHVADAAPIAPTWDRIAAGDPAPAGRRPRRGFELALVAAVVALVVVGVIALRRSGDEQPADQPPAPTSTVATETVPLAGLGAFQAVDAALCLTRRNARLVSEHDLTGLVGADDLPGFDTERAVLFGYRPMALVWAVATSHPDLGPGDADSLAPLVDAYRTADASAFAGPEASIGPGFPALVDEVATSFGSYVDTVVDPAVCQPQAPSAAAARDEAVCIAAVRLRRLLDERGTTGLPADDALIDAAGAAFRLWWETTPDRIEQLASDLASAMSAPADERDLAPLIDAIDADLLPDGTCVVPPDGQPVAQSTGGQP